MDIDSPEQTQVEEIPQRQGKAKDNFVVVVDAAHPFDLEAYISSYSGRTVFLRLCHIIQHCPKLALPAFQLARKHILSGRDPSLYEQVVKIYQSATNSTDVPAIEKSWLDAITTENARERTKLEVELKTYQSNMIKESIRMAHRDLGVFYQSVGDGATALKHYTKTREFCSTSRHILDMCLQILELLTEQLNYAHLSTYVYKAESALEGAVAPSTSTGKDAAEGSSAAPASKLLHKKATGSGSTTTHSPERDLVHTKIEVALALSHLGQGHYEKAAQTFTRLEGLDRLGDWASKVISPSDIAIYGTLCALATFTRGGIKVQLLENEHFGIYMEQELYVRDLVEAYVGNKFKRVLELLEMYSARHLLDIHLAPHINELTKLIRDRALVLYFTPFASIRLPLMANAFGLDVDELEKQVVRLIENGEIKARVDSQNKILKAKKEDHRTAVFSRAIKTGTEMMETNRKLLLRMRLQQADLIVKAPKSQQNLTAGQQMEFMMTE